MSRTVVGLDWGSGNARIVVGRLVKGAFEIHDAAVVPSEDVGAALGGMGLRGARIHVGVTGRDMILRTIQVPPVPAWQLRELMAFEVDDVAEQSGEELAADYNVLGGAAAFGDEDLVLLALVRRHWIDDRIAELASTGARPAAFTPNAVALYNAFVATDGGDGTVMVAHLGGRTTDVALVHDGELLFARNLAGGGEVFTSAIADAFGVERDKAEAVKRRHGVLARPGERLAGQQGAVSRALEGGARQVTNMLRSSVVLCRNQLAAPELAPQRVLLCGPGSSVPGLDESLSRSLDVPVERFDPSAGYVVGEVAVLEERGADFAVPIGLAMMGALPDAYRIEILDEGARRRRAFRRTTAWLLAAALLVVASLGHHVVTARRDHGLARAELARLQREVRERTAEAREHARAVREAEELAARLAEIEAQTAPGAGVLAALALLERHLPEELWLTGLRTERRIDPEIGGAAGPRPYVVVEGRGKEMARELSTAVTELTTRLRAEPAVVHALPSLTTDSQGEFSFEVRLDVGTPRAAGAGVGGAGEMAASADAPLAADGDA